MHFVKSLDLGLRNTTRNPKSTLNPKETLSIGTLNIQLKVMYSEFIFNL